MAELLKWFDFFFSVGAAVASVVALVFACLSWARPALTEAARFSRFWWWVAVTLLGISLVIDWYRGHAS